MLDFFYKKNKLITGLQFMNRNLVLNDRSFIGKTIYVYNGRKFVSLLIKENMLNYKLGDFVFTRRILLKKKKKKYGARRKSN